MCNKEYNGVNEEHSSEGSDEFNIPLASIPPVFEEEEPTVCAICGKSEACSCVLLP